MFSQAWCPHAVIATGGQADHWAFVPASGTRAVHIGVHRLHTCGSADSLSQYDEQKWLCRQTRLCGTVLDHGCVIAMRPAFPTAVAMHQDLLYSYSCHAAHWFKASSLRACMADPGAQFNGTYCHVAGGAAQHCALVGVVSIHAPGGSCRAAAECACGC